MADSWASDDDGDPEVSLDEFKIHDQDEGEPADTPSSCCVLIYDLDMGHNELLENPEFYLTGSINSLKNLQKPAIRDVECCMNEMTNAVSVACITSTDEEVHSELKKVFCDNYLRARHELFFRLCCKLLRSDPQTSDEKFSDKFDIESNKTPDRIFVNGNVVSILEVTVTTNVEQAAFQKGGMGYTPKYAKEIDSLITMGLSVHYCVCILDASDSTNKDHYVALKNLCEHQGIDYDRHFELDMDYYQVEMVNIQRLVSKFFVGELVSLFSEAYSLEAKVTDKMKTLMSTNTRLNEFVYSKMTVNVEIYNKMIFRWNRFNTYLNRFNKDERVSLFYDFLSPNFRFKPHLVGPRVSDWHIALINDDRMFVVMNTYTELASNVSKLTESDRGLHFYTLQKKSSKNQRSKNLKFRNYSVLHPFEFDVCKDEVDCPAADEDWMNVCSQFEDTNYEGKILGMIKGWDESQDFRNLPKGMLCNCENNPESAETALKAFSDRLMEQNNFEVSIPVKMYKHKVSFMYPLADLSNTVFTHYRQKPLSLLRSLLTIQKVGEYTKVIVGKAVVDSFEFGTLIDPRLFDTEYNELRQSYISANLTYHKTAKNLAKAAGLDKIPTKKEFLERCPEYAHLYEEVLSTKKKFDRFVDVKKLPKQKLPLVKINSRGKNSLYKKFFETEMSHFNKGDEQSTISGVGLMGGLDMLYNKQKRLYESLRNFMLSPSCNPISDKIMDLKSYDDVKLLKDFKELHIKDTVEKITKLEGTNLYNSCAFVSRLCHSLMYYSQCSFSADYVAVDNLGMDNVLLIVRGGKKIFRTKQTKMFKIFYPVNSCYADYLTDNKTSSSFVHEINDELMMETPWVFMKEALVSEGISFLHKCMGYAVMNWKESSSLFASMNTCYFNIYLAFHSRRKTEEFMHSFRYLLVNNMGEFSNLEGLLPEFAGFNYDYVQQYLRLCLLKEYSALAESMRIYKSNSNLETALAEADVKHIFNGHQILDLEGLSRYIYSSYLMTKAPINQMTEQTKNLKSIMETHESAMAELKDNSISIEKDDDWQTYSHKLFKSDFNFDPYFCTLLGKFMSDFLLAKNTRSDITKLWETTLNKSWDSMANSKGLRGDLKGNEFFGEKGYYIISKDLIDRGKLDDVIALLKSEENDYKKRSELAKMNETFRTKCAENLDCLVFHVVDKRQRGGSREIYVMDMKTKLSQQPIESFLAKLCKMVPNELISVPSNRRLQNIHSQVFERGFDTTNKENYYLTLDCRKWAPKSNLDKYVVFILGMSNCLPPSFMKHFINFFGLMYSKKNVTRVKVMENFLKSEANSKYKKWFETTNDAAHFEMPYSFMMGIFNFLSSLMHVANQMYMSYIINLSSKNNLERDSYLHMMAHSDDSAGKAIVNSEQDMKRVLMIYEVGLKAANHLISIKKSVVSKVYFEFLSVLYIMNQLVPLLPKFMSGITFRPVDKGYCVDALQSYSKCIELILNGAHFEQAYIYMKVQSHLIWRFYFNDNPKEEDYQIPPQMGGMPDPHPISVLLVGTDSDLLRLKYSLGDEAASVMLKFSNLLSLETSTEEGLLKSFSAKPNIKQSKRMFIDAEDQIRKNLPELSGSWAIKNLSFKNTPLNLIQTLLKTQDSSFLAALQDEEIMRRISRAYYFRSTQCLETKIGYISYRQLRQYFNAVNTLRFSDVLGVEPVFKAAGIPLDEKSLTILNDEISQSTDLLNKVSGVLYTEVTKYFNYMNRIRLNEGSSEIKYKTCKPVHMNIMRTAQPLSNISDISSIIVWLKEPENKYLLSNVAGLQTAANVLESYLTDVGLDLNTLDCAMAYKLARKIFNSSEKDYYFYSNMPAGVREINNYQDICLMLANNSKKDFYFTGLNIPFSRSPGVLLGDYMPTVSVEEFVETTAYLSLIIAAYSTDREKVELITDLEWQSPTFLGMKVVGIGELLELFENYWKPSQICYGYINTYLTISTMLVSHRLMIDHSGALAGDLGFIMKGYFYVYVKTQKLVSNKWMGRGKLLINTPNGVFLFEHDGNRLKKVTTTMKKGSMSKVTVEYINMVLSESRLQTLQYSFKSLHEEASEYHILGVDRNGVVCLENRSNLEFGFEDVECVDSINELNRIKHLKSVTLESSGSLLVTMGDELESRNTWRICFYPLDMAAVSKHISTLFAPPEVSLKNYQLASSGTGHFGSYIRSNLLSMFNRPLYIPFDSFFSGIRSSRLYSIFSALNRSNPRCFDEIDSFEPPSGPSPSNGLLSCLVEYKDIDGKFKFDTEPFLTQHLMAMKSQQPEQYLSTLERHMEAMYENLYTVEEKDEMIHELIEVSDALIKPGSRSSLKVTELMSKWGYSALVSGISVFKVDRSNKLHNMFVRESLKPKLASTLAEKFGFLTKTIYETFKMNKHALPELFVDKEHFDLGYNFDTFERHFYSFIALVNYWRVKMQTFIYTNDSPSGLFVVQVFQILLNSNTLSADFKRFMSKDDLFMHFRVCAEDLQQWVMTMCSSLNYYIVLNEVFVKGSLLMDLQYDRLESYNKFKKFDYSNMVSYHSFQKFGLLSEQLVSDLKVKHTCNGHYYSPVLKQHGRPIPMHPDVVFEGVVSEDAFDCDEWESLVMEMQSNEPDMDEVEAAIESVTEEAGEFYVETSDKVKGKLHFHELSIITALFSSKTRLLAFCSRQVGDNILAICDSFDEDFLSSLPNTRAYKPGKSWKFKLLTREMVCILVSFRNGIPEGFAQCYDLNPIHKKSNKMYRQAYLGPDTVVDLGAWQRSTGAEKNEIQLKLKGFHSNQSIEEEGASSEVAGTADEKPETELDKLLKRCVGMGLPETSASCLHEILSSMEKGPELESMEELMRSMLSDALSTSKNLSEIKKKMSETIKSSLKNRAQLESMLQVPLMLQKGGKNEKTRANIHFRDEQVRAELDSISSGLTDIIVSGTLTITQEEREELYDVIELCDNYLKNNQGSPEAMFFTMMAKMILNDAFQVEEETREHSAIWKNLRRKLISKVVRTKGRLSQQNNPFNIQPTGSSLNYKFSGYPDD